MHGRWGSRQGFQGRATKIFAAGRQVPVRSAFQLPDAREPAVEQSAPGPARTIGGMPQAVIAFCTCPDTDTAARIAEALVGERLAACVSVLPGVQSVYRWQGAVERADEVQLLVKTVAARMPALAERIAALHPYELPELVAVEAAAGLPAYLDWIGAETAPDAGRQEP